MAADVPGLRARRRADHARHERRAPLDVRRRPDARAAHAPPRRAAGSSDPATPRSGRRCATIPNEELWAARCAARARARRLRSRAKPGQDRLQRGEQIDYVRAIETGLDAGRAHARLRPPLRDLQARLPAHARPGPRAPHPLGRARRCSCSSPARRTRTTTAARTCSSASTSFKRDDAAIGDRVVIVEDYDLDVARAARLRLRRLDQPAAAADGGERHERHEGDVQRRAPAQRPRRLVGRGLRRRERLGDPGDEDSDPNVVDARDAERFYDLLEHEVIPLFYDRDERRRAARAGASGSSTRSSRARRPSARRGWSTTTSRRSTRGG